MKNMKSMKERFHVAAYRQGGKRHRLFAFPDLPFMFFMFLMVEALDLSEQLW